MLKLQKILQSMGYDVGKVDGILGRKTRQSVRSIQMWGSLQIIGQQLIFLTPKLTYNPK